MSELITPSPCPVCGHMVRYNLLDSKTNKPLFKCSYATCTNTKKVIGETTNEAVKEWNAWCKEYRATHDYKADWEAGMWVDSDKVMEITGMTFSECLRAFKFSRGAEWMPSPFNGQNVMCQFKKE